MERRSRSIESYRRRRRDSTPRRHYHRKRYERSRSRSYSRSRSRTRSYTRSRSRSYSRGRRSKFSHGRDLYKDLVEPDYEEYDKTSEKLKNNKYYSKNSRRSNSANGNGSNSENNFNSYQNRRYNNNTNNNNNDDKYHQQKDRKRKHHYSPDRNESDASYDYDINNFYDETPNSTIIIRGLSSQITEADLTADLLQYHLQPVSIRVIRKYRTGTSRCFAFVEFTSPDEASRWMAYKQGHLEFQDCKAVMQYSHHGVPKEYQQQPQKTKVQTDWYCVKCGVFNFKRRENCFKCCASREESEKGGEGSDEVSNILTKKVMLRNLDVLTTEESVLTIMQDKIPNQVEKITKILICRDPLTQTSRGICYLHFDNLVDSMNTHNCLSGLEPPLNIEGRDVLVSYCVDAENRIVNPLLSNSSKYSGKLGSDSNSYSAPYTLADVPRLAEYSATLYATNLAEKEHYLKYYTNYYVSEITRGHFENLPNMNQLGESANSGAAVALSAMQRKMKYDSKHNKKSQRDYSSSSAPDTRNYQYDPTSGYYYDPVSKLYYDPNTQYYYNNETGVYYYYDLEKQMYLTVVVTTAPATSTVSSTVSSSSKITEQIQQDTKKSCSEIFNETMPKPSGKQDKVKVAKKIVKDMEKWAKQLNQKKDMLVIPSVTPTVTTTTTVSTIQPQIQPIVSIPMKSNYGCADIGFSLLEPQNKLKRDETSEVRKFTNTYNSDSDDHTTSQTTEIVAGPSQQNSKSDSDIIVDFAKLTCLLCKRAFQSEDILQKHLKMSKLHLENLAKHKKSSSFPTSGSSSNQEYRDRAKERRLKYGEFDPPPVNRSKERFEKRLESLNEVKPSSEMPIASDNVGNRLLQKMGWQEGQGLGKSNQGRTKIIEADGRSSQAGLGSKVSQFGPGDDYKSYIKRMMKSRYEQVDVKK